MNIPPTNYHRFHYLYVRIITTKYSNMAVHAQKPRNIFTCINYYKINYVKEHDSRFPFANERNASLKSGCFQSEFGASSCRHLQHIHVFGETGTSANKHNWTFKIAMERRTADSFTHKCEQNVVFLRLLLKAGWQWNHNIWKFHIFFWTIMFFQSAIEFLKAVKAVLRRAIIVRSFWECVGSLPH